MNEQKDNFDEEKENLEDKFDDPFFVEEYMKDREFSDPFWEEDIAEEMADRQLEDVKIKEKIGIVAVLTQNDWPLEKGGPGHEGLAGKF